MQHSTRQESGFTLLELLMVVFVVGIMAGLAVMSIGGNAEREFRKDAARIQQVLTRAQDEAPYSGEEIGFWLDPEGQSYGFLRFDNEKLEWQPLAKPEFADYKLPEQYQLDLNIAGARVDMVALYKEVYKKSDKLENWIGNDKPAKKPIVPWLIFFSDGHYMPFRLQLSTSRVKGSVYIIDGDGLGSIHIKKSSQRETKRKAPRD